MSFSDYDSVKEQIREAIDIVDLVGRFIPLKRSGRNYVGRCPWHDDSRPSLQVNPERQSFKCWVCDIGGDVFSFMQQMENVDFRESMRLLADMAGVSMPKPHKKKFHTDSPGHEPLPPGEEDINIDKKTMYNAMDWVRKHYHKCLLSDPEAEIALEYLKRRGIEQESIEKFSIGYVPIKSGWLLKQHKNPDSRAVRVLEKTGVLGRGERGESYDFFRGRLLFPIRDTMDHVVAFGGRIIPNSTYQSERKYLNSADSEIFSKFRMLYGLDLARSTIRKSHRVLIMEGYTDCIMAHQQGLTDAVAVLGTALGVEHIRLLKRQHAEKMILVLDGDEAGQKKTGEVIEFFFAEQANLFVLTLPEGADPCEFLLENGADVFNEYLEANMREGLEHLIYLKTRNIDWNNVVETSEALNQVLEVFVNALRNTRHSDNEYGIWLGKSIQKIARKFGVEETKVRERLKGLQNSLNSRRQYRDERPDGPQEEESDKNSELDVEFDPQYAPESIEREMLELWIANPESFVDFFEEIETEPDLLIAPLTKRLYAFCSKLLDRGRMPSFEAMIVHYDDRRMKNFLIELEDSGAAKGLAKMEPEQKTQLFSQLMQGLIKRRENRILPKKIEELEAGSEDEKTARLKELLETRKQRIGK